MNRRLFENILLTISITLSLIVILNYSISKIQNKNNDLTSKEMRDEIIRQLKEKEGMTIEDYILKQYFERLMEEIK